MDIWLSTELDNEKQGLLEAYELMMKHSKEAPDECKDPKVYLEMFEKLWEIKNEATQHEKALQVAKEASTPDEFDDIYNQELAKFDNKKTNIKRLNEYKEFEKSLREIEKNMKDISDATPSTSAAAAGDILMTESTINIKDPLTKLPIENPMRNNVCGHHYDKATILDVLSKNTKLRCPVAGCGNKKFIIKSHLVEDAEMKRRIMQSKQEQDDELED